MDKQIKTDKELTIELRDKISGRLIENRANLLFWQDIVRRAPKLSEQIKEGREKVLINETNIDADIKFLKIIDEILKKYK